MRVMYGSEVQRGWANTTSPKGVARPRLLLSTMKERARRATIVVSGEILVRNTTHGRHEVEKVMLSETVKVQPRTGCQRKSG